MPIWLMALMAGGPIIQQIAGIFHKDDPANPTVQTSQAPQMFMQQMLPMLMMMSMGSGKDNGGSDMLPMFMMMQMMGINPAQALTPTATTMDATIKAMADMQAQMKMMSDMIASMEKKQ